MELVDIFNTYKQNIQDAVDIIDFAYSRYANGHYKYPKKIRVFNSKNAFLKIYISWESFLEASFISYMLGKSSTSGRTLVRYVTPLDSDHAQKLLIGTQRYFDWGNSENLRKLSKLYFENGEPFNGIIGSIVTDLSDLKTIRNAAAHISSTTSTQLDAVASRILNRSIVNIDVSDFIFSIDPNNGTQTILDMYLAILEAAAVNITNF
jgi:hypothetical protein